MTFAVHPISSHQQVWKPGQALQDAVTLSAKVPTIGAAQGVFRFKADVPCTLSYYYLRPDGKTRYDGQALPDQTVAAGTEGFALLDASASAWVEITVTPTGNGQVTYADIFLRATQDDYFHPNFDARNTSTRLLLRQVGGGWFQSGVKVPAVALQQSHFHLRMPASSGRLVISGGFFPQSYGAATDLELRRLDVDVGYTQAGRVNADFGSPVSPTLVVAYGNGAVPAQAGPVLVTYPSVAPLFNVTESGVVLEPGQGILFSTVSPNVELRLNFTWYELPYRTAGPMDGFRLDRFFKISY
jgi:hypothetical protein